MDKKRAIQAAAETMEGLHAGIAKHEADATQLTRETAGHDEDIPSWMGDMNAAAKVREIAKAGYDAMHKDYSESVDALVRAVAFLKTQAYDRTHASPAQVSRLKSLALIPMDAKRAIDPFLM